MCKQQNTTKLSHPMLVNISNLFKNSPLYVDSSACRRITQVLESLEEKSIKDCLFECFNDYYSIEKKHNFGINTHAPNKTLNGITTCLQLLY